MGEGSFAKARGAPGGSLVIGRGREAVREAPREAARRIGKHLTSGGSGAGPQLASPPLNLGGEGASGGVGQERQEGGWLAG